MHTKVNTSSPATENASSASTRLSRRGFLGTGLAFAGTASAGLIAPAQAHAESKAPMITGRKVISSDTNPCG
jgi:hypothetical protein